MPTICLPYSFIRPSQMIVIVPPLLVPIFSLVSLSSVSEEHDASSRMLVHLSSSLLHYFVPLITFTQGRPVCKPIIINEPQRSCRDIDCPRDSRCRMERVSAIFCGFVSKIHKYQIVKIPIQDSRCRGRDCSEQPVCVREERGATCRNVQCPSGLRCNIVEDVRLFSIRLCHKEDSISCSRTVVDSVVVRSRRALIHATASVVPSEPRADSTDSMRYVHPSVS